MQLGKFNRRITLQKPAEGRKPSGQTQAGWLDVARPWAWIRGKSGRETMESGQEVASEQYSMRIRFRSDVAASWRVLYRGEPYDIKVVLPDEAGRQHVDLVVERGARRA